MWGICKSDITRHLARSDVSDDALSFLAIFVAPVHSWRNAALPADFMTQGGVRKDESMSNG